MAVLGEQVQESLLQAKEVGASRDFVNKPLPRTGFARGHGRLKASLLVIDPLSNVPYAGLLISTLFPPQGAPAASFLSRAFQSSEWVLDC